MYDGQRRAIAARSRCGGRGHPAASLGCRAIGVADEQPPGARGSGGMSLIRLGSQARRHLRYWWQGMQAEDHPRYSHNPQAFPSKPNPECGV